MINEQENKTSVMSDLEYTKNDTEMMRYRVNGLSNKFGLLGMILSLFAAFICLNSMRPITFQVILIILYNIVILLGGFLAAEKVKSYSAKGAIAELVFGGVCIARIFYIPVMLISWYGKYKAALADGDTAMIDECKKHLGVTITAKDGGKVANAFLPSSGTFRGVMAIVLLSLAATCFIISGITGYLRAKKLSTYMNSLKVETK